ncbi:MAG: 5-formyltetrahydrofolate cyclo-ligase [Enterococcus lacertideformus]|uniref:5-formyltetrahydrofolate cyclo-ligase n=1 Tax=Enterococcus lacertideformus TaxID=2771493 RepID=A0A931AZF4_9ENTE|nr:5-formyltetrahydrofolate cyclo-ligase [Enterococcus lacertideformus]
MNHIKEKLRKLGIQQLKNIAISGCKHEKEQKIYHKLFQSKEWNQAQVVGLTIANTIEVSTKAIVETAMKEGKTVLAPKTFANRNMEFFKIDHTTIFERTNFGVLEPVSEIYFMPEKIDLLLVPGIIYHTDGYRIGFGGGYFDRYLTNYSNQTCSLVFHEQINNQWTPESFDKKIQRLFID